MKLSAPIYLLKQQAKVLARRQRIPLHEALDRIARREGFNGWSLLAARAIRPNPAKSLLARLAPGNLVLLAARPFQGKTLLGLELIVEAMKAGRRGVFFTFEYNETDIRARFAAIGADPRALTDRFEFDNSDHISASYIAQRLDGLPAGTLVVVDYLQLLDQKRENPALTDQVKALKAFAEQRQMIFVFISQVHWRYDPTARACPELGDVRLPNPLDLSLFDTACFLNEGELRVASVA